MASTSLINSTIFEHNFVCTPEIMFNDSFPEEEIALGMNALLVYVTTSDGKIFVGIVQKVFKADKIKTTLKVCS